MGNTVSSQFLMNGSREMLQAGAAHLESQIVALEAAVSSNAGLAFDLSKTLIESACKTILSERGREYQDSWDLPKLLKETLGQLQLVPDDLDGETDVSGSLKKAAGGLQTTIQGICELRNSHGFASHGKDPAFQELESVQALLVARAADAIISFIFLVHNGYQSRQSLARLAYNDHPLFNDFIDGSNEMVQVFREEFIPSRVLFELAPEPYRLYLTEFLQEEKNDDGIAESEPTS